jgi:hypothetical protein
VVALRTDTPPRRAPLRLVVAPPAEVAARVRPDALPEHTEYRDSGCELSKSCLACPLSRCKYDASVGSRKLAVEPRDREIAYLRRRYRAPIAMLATNYGLTRRTIFRILREQRSADMEQDDGRRRRAASA